MNCIAFSVEGNPIAKQSFRFSRKGHYTAASISAWQNAVAWRARIAMQGNDPIHGRVSVRLIFSLGNKRIVDCDNLAKGVLDSIKGIVFGDDHYVVHLVKQQNFPLFGEMTFPQVYVKDVPMQEIPF